MKKIAIAKVFIIQTFLFLLSFSSSAQLLKVAIAGLKHDHIYGILQDYVDKKVDILGIAESDRSVIEKYKKKFNLPDVLFYNSLSDLLKKNKPEIVLGYNPVSEHVDIVEICAPLHIPVMVEKPLAATLQQAERMAFLAHKFNISVLTNYETSWYSSYQQAYRSINEEQTVGSLRKIVAHDGHSGPVEIGCSKDFLNWLTDPVKNGGGAVMDFGCYGANLMTWLMHNKTPVSVTAVIKHIKPQIYPKVDDDASILVEYPNTTGIIEASWNWPFGIKDLELFGKTGYYHALNGNTLQQRLTEKEPLTNVALSPYQYKNNIEYLTDVLHKGVKIDNDLSSLENNLIVMKILDAAKRSAKEGKKIFLSDDKKVKPLAVIFDSDMGPDYDDVGAITLLHSFADSGYINILATMASTNYDGVAAVFNVFNTYFNRPSIPIGLPKRNGLKLKDWQHWTDTIIANYPHYIKSNDQVQDATTLYRKILSAQPDKSVTIISVGFFTNLANLLHSPPDQYSSLTGKQLINLKVKQLVSMAGRFPSGKEFNIEKDAASSQYVFENWPTPVLFSGFEIGANIKTGLPLIHDQYISHSPVKDVFSISIPKAEEDKEGRKSWDETAVLVAVKGYQNFYNINTGAIKVLNDGSNIWDTKGTKHAYLVERSSPEEVSKIINKLIMHQPM